MKTILSVLFLIAVLGAGPSAYAISPLLRVTLAEDLAEKQLFDLNGQLGILPGDVTAADNEVRWFDQRLDHADASSRVTFRQRYFVDSRFATSSDSPVFLYICGESECAPRFRALLVYAKNHHATLVALEHRYYGKSLPFTDLSNEHLKYLTLEQALQDISAFQSFAHDQLGLKGKWMSFGGSYAGAMSAFLRSRFPDQFSASLASSGPVISKINFEEYDEHVSKVAGDRCGALLRKATLEAESALNSNEQLQKLKTTFGIQTIRDPIEILYDVADQASYAFQYGHRDEFCATLEAAPPTEILETYGNYTKKLLASFNLTGEGISFQSAEDLKPNETGTRQWMYQSCTEFGYFQNAYHDPAVAVRSQKVNSEFHEQVCERLFGIKRPNIERTNDRYYLPLLKQMTASKILFTNGSRDPWSRLSITSQNGNDINPDNRAYLIEGAAHCDDLRIPTDKDSVSLKQARTLTEQLLEGWL